MKSIDNSDFDQTIANTLSVSKVQVKLFKNFIRNKFEVFLMMKVDVTQKVYNHV